jgi:hypothetical protein
MNYDSLELYSFGQHAEVRAIRKAKSECVTRLSNTSALRIHSKILE